MTPSVTGSPAVDWHLIPSVPQIKWLRTPLPEFDFLTFEEAARLIGWTDRGSTSGLARRYQHAENGRTREIPLSQHAAAALREHPRRSELVFSAPDGSMLSKGAMKWPLWNACKNAGLRRIGWHSARHTFASHLVMRGAPIKAVQELMGHSTI